MKHLQSYQRIPRNVQKNIPMVEHSIMFSYDHYKKTLNQRLTYTDGIDSKSTWVLTSTKSTFVGVVRRITSMETERR